MVVRPSDTLPAWLALAEAGHEVQIFLLGEAVGFMRKTLANAVTPVGWPPVGETLDKGGC